MSKLSALLAPLAPHNFVWMQSAMAWSVFFETAAGKATEA